MFKSWKLARKLKAFRSGTVRCTKYDEDKKTITLESGSWQVELAFGLTTYDNCLQLVFSGDVITRDGESLARVMKTMWNYKLPEFPNSDELRVQLWGEDSSEISDDANFCEDESTPAKRDIYFRDMSTRVMGMPNEVIVSVKSSYLIDND